MDQRVVVPPDGSSCAGAPTTIAARIAQALDRVAPSTGEATAVMVGPRCALDYDAPIAGTYVVALDGSIGDEGVIPVVAAWTVAFGGTPWLVDVVERWWRQAPDVIDSAYVSHRANRLRRRIGCDVEHETLHGDRPARAILEFAGDTRAALIFVGIDGDTRRARRRRRSLATGIARHATCPVVLLRLPEVRHAARPPSKPDPPASPPVWSRAWCERYAPDVVKLRRVPTRTPPRSRR